MSTRILPLALSSLLIALPAGLQAQTFTESDFAPGSYSVTKVVAGNSTSSTSTAAAGNPGSSLTVSINFPVSPTTGAFCTCWHYVFVFPNGATFDPAPGGGLLGFSFSLDHDTLSAGALQLEGAALRQGGKLYLAGTAIATQDSWATTTSPKLAATDFQEMVNLPPCTSLDAASHPDFGPTGAPIELGFARSYAMFPGLCTGPYFDSVGADNWAMTVLPHWLDAGQAKAGTAGTPALEGSGALAAGGTGELRLTGAAPAAAATLVAGLDSLNAPFKGGTLVPQPQILLGFATDGAGEVTLPWTWPAGVPADESLYVQFWIADGGASHGFAASNALVGTTS